MKTVKLYKYLVLALVVINVSFLVFFFATKPKHGPNNKKPKPPHHLLNLDAEQEEELFALIQSHEQKSKSINQNHKTLLVELIKVSGTEQNDIRIESLKDEIFELDQQRLASLLEHFEQVKLILRDDQLNNFDEFQSKVLGNIFNHEKRRRAKRK